tara:strand:- start:8753 stop:8962 length:210 start_codon:yes stop_codon:yes gene_type:complete
MSHFDDNFGEWEGMSPSHPDFEDNLRFYKQVQARSVVKTCRGCDRKVRILPDYAYCDGCATKIEQGWDL